MSEPSSRAARWTDFVARRYRHILWGALLLSLVSAASLTRIRLDLDLIDMLPRGAPAFDDFRSFVADFGQLDELVILVEGDEPLRLQSFADRFATELSKSDLVRHVQARLNVDDLQQGLFGRYLFNYIPVSAYDEVGRRLTAAGLAEQLARDRAILSAPFDLRAARLVRRDPLGLLPLAARGVQATAGDTKVDASGYLASPDGRALLVLARPNANAFAIDFSTRLMSSARDVEQLVRQQLDDTTTRVSYTGSYAYAVEDAATLQWDIHRYVILALVGVIAVFYCGYRNLRILPFLALPLALNTLVTFAASVVMYASLNAVSTSFAAILYGLSVDSGVHYYTRLVEERRRRDLRDAVRATLAGLGGANFVASATTAAVFWIIGLSALRGVSQLGSLTAFGMVLNVVQFFVIYPAMSFWLLRNDPGLDVTTPRLAALAEWSARRAGIVNGVTVALVLVAAAYALSVHVDSDLTRLRPRGSQAARTQDRIGELFGTSASAGAVLVRAESVEEALVRGEEVEAVLQRYVERGDILSLRTLSGVLPSAQIQRARLSRLGEIDLPSRVDTIRSALVDAGFAADRFAELFSQLERRHDEVVTLEDPALDPFRTLLARHLRQVRGENTVAAYIEPAPGVSLADVATRLHRDLPGATFTVTGRPLLEDELRGLLGREVWIFFLGSLLLNLVIVVVQFRDVWMSTVILLPSALIVVACFAMMRLTGWGVGPVNVIVIPLILGIGVDYAVYLAERFVEEGEIRRAALGGGRALVISALSTMAGFGFLGLSEYPALAQLGWLTAACLLLCLIASLTLMPALLALRSTSTSGKTTPPSTT